MQTNKHNKCTYCICLECQWNICRQTAHQGTSNQACIWRMYTFSKTTRHEEQKSTPSILCNCKNRIVTHTFILKNNTAAEAAWNCSLSTHTFKRTQARNLMPTQIYHKEESLQAATFGSQMYHQWHDCALRSQSSPISHCYETGEAQNQWDTPLILSLCCASWQLLEF